MKKSPNQPQIIFEDDALIVFSKPSGMPVSPAMNSNEKISLCEWVHNKINPNFFNVHRIDAETSGIVLFAKNKEILKKLAMQFESKEVTKI